MDCQKQTRSDRTYVILTHFMTYISDALKYGFLGWQYDQLVKCMAQLEFMLLYISQIYIYDVNDIHHTSLYLYMCDILESICEKDTNIEHEIKYDMKKCTQ